MNFLKDESHSNYIWNPSKIGMSWSIMSFSNNNITPISSIIIPAVPRNKLYKQKDHGFRKVYYTPAKINPISIPCLWKPSYATLVYTLLLQRLWITVLLALKYWIRAMENILWQHLLHCMLWPNVQVLVFTKVLMIKILIKSTSIEHVIENYTDQISTHQH